MRYKVINGDSITHKTNYFESENEAINYAKSLNNENPYEGVRVIDDSKWSLSILWQNSKAIDYWG